MDGNCNRFHYDIRQYHCGPLATMVWSLSDRLESRYGRRTPFIMLGLPTAVVCLFLIPFFSQLFVFIAIILCFNLSMAFYRPPIMSLMPDKIPTYKRSTANSYISLMGGHWLSLRNFNPENGGIDSWNCPYHYGRTQNSIFFSAGLLGIPSCRFNLHKNQEQILKNATTRKLI